MAELSLHGYDARIHDASVLSDNEIEALQEEIQRIHAEALRMKIGRQVDMTQRLLDRLGFEIYARGREIEPVYSDAELVTA